MYEFFMDRIRLPVAPGKMDVKISSQNKTVTLINEGEINILKAPGLTEVSFTVLLPNLEYPFAVYEGGFKNAQYYLYEFQRLKERTDGAGRYLPFLFLVSQSMPNGTFLSSFEMEAVLEDYKITEEAENGFDVSVDVSLKQYKRYGTRALSVNGDGTAAVENSRPVANPPTKPDYTVSGGDSLWSIAQKMLGDGNRYPEIYELNKEAIDKQNEGTGNTRYTIYPGQTFVIPQDGGAADEI